MLWHVGEKQIKIPTIDLYHLSEPDQPNGAQATDQK